MVAKQPEKSSGMYQLIRDVWLQFSSQGAATNPPRGQEWAQSVLSRRQRQWLQDTLSDDEVEIPLEIDIPHDDADIDAGESEAARKEESKWTDLDLDTFRPRE